MRSYRSVRERALITPREWRVKTQFAGRSLPVRKLVTPSPQRKKNAKILGCYENSLYLCARNQKRTMTYIGELISIGVAFSWTATAMLSEFGSKRIGNLTLNVLRMALALLFSLVLESPLDSKKIKPVNPKGNQHWKD